MKSLPLFALLFCSCVTTNKPAAHFAVTAPTRTSVTRAAEAAHEAQVASERSSVHIRESQAASERSSAHIKVFKSDAERIDYKASRALRILDHP